MTKDLKKAEDVELIALAKKGSAKAFEELHRRYKTAIMTFARKKLGSTIDAEDFSQTVFMKAFNALNSYEPRFKFSTWLLRISTNLMVDEFRKHGKKAVEAMSISNHVSDDQEGDFELKDLNKTPLQETESNENKELVRKAIEEHLSFCGYKELVYARFYEDKALADIAEEFNIPLGTVKAKIHRAQAILAKHLSKILITA